MNINGLLVHANPDKTDDVHRRLNTLRGVDVHERTDDGRFVITVEDVDGADPGDAILEIHRMEGVLSAVLVFHRIEDEARAGSAAA
jgi:nitrate reductase NapD